MSGERAKFEERIIAYLSHVKGEKIDITAQVYKMLVKEEKAGEKLRYFLETADDIESSEEQETEVCFKPKQLGELRIRLRGLVREIVNSLIQRNPTEQEFYDEIWQEGIQENSLLKTEEEKIYALYCIWMDSRIPYFHLDAGIKMNNEEFKKICLENEKKIRKAFFIVNNQFSQKTERSSLLNELLENATSKEEKAVLMAQILNAMERKTLRQK